MSKLLTYFRMFIQQVKFVFTLRNTFLKKQKRIEHPHSMFLCLKKHIQPQKNKEGLRTVIPGKDQGSYLNGNTKASESTMQVHRLDS